MKKAFYIVGILILLVGVVTYAGKWETRSAQSFGGAVLDDDLVTGTIDLAATSAQYTLPKQYDPYIICAHTKRAFVLCGADPTSATTAGSYAFSIPANGCIGPIRLKGPKCAHIAATAAGQIEFLHFDSRLY